MAMCERKDLELVKKYIGKRVFLEYYIDSSFKIEGTPQYNRILYVNGIQTYNQNLQRNNRDLWNEHYALFKFGRDIGQFTKHLNYYNRWDFKMEFVVTMKLIKLVEDEIGE